MGRRLAATALVTALAIALAGVAAFAGAPPSTVVAALLLAFVPYAGLLVVDVRGAGTRGALWLAALSGAVLVAAPSALSDDVYRYLWDARVSLHGRDPYALAPDAPALAALRDPAWARINHRDIPTIYPPLAQLWFAAACALWSSVHALKLAGLLCHLASAAAVGRWARARLERGAAAPDPVRCAYLFALNPLALSESALGGHVDAGVGLCVLVLAAALDAGRHRVAAAAVVAAAGLKLVGLALWPLLLRRRAAYAWLGLSLAALMLWPVVGAGHGNRDSSGLQHYTQRWRGNEGAFAGLELGLRMAIDALAPEPPPEGVGPAQVRVALLRPLLARVAGGPLDPSAALRAERKQRGDPAVLDRAHFAGLLARILAAAVVLGVALALALRRADAARATRLVLLCALLLAPQVHPWYLLWLLPLEIALGKRVLLVWSAAVLLAYAPLDAWVAQRAWIEPVAIRAFQYAWVALALLAELARISHQRRLRRG